MNTSANFHPWIDFCQKIEQVESFVFQFSASQLPVNDEKIKNVLDLAFDFVFLFVGFSTNLFACNSYKVIRDDINDGIKVISYLHISSIEQKQGVE